MLKNETVFCTYFDKNYLLKGLAMCSSLVKYNPWASLWVLPMDLYSLKILKKMNLANVTLIDKKAFEDEKLLKAKKNRSRVEYIWTCTPSLPLYVFKENKKAEKVIYLDSDLFFFSGVEPAIKELGKGSIYTVEHRYPPSQRSRLKTSGRFNVGFQIFTRTEESEKCLKRWRKQCIEWCYWRYEDGKIGDQGYLNEWPDLYENLVISKNLGVNTAPWNVGQYKVSKKNGKIFINKDRLICYHFHQFQILSENSFSHTYGYNLSKDVVNYIYKPYEKEIKRQIKRVKQIDKNFRIASTESGRIRLLKQKITKILAPIYWETRSKFN